MNHDEWIRRAARVVQNGRTFVTDGARYTVTAFSAYRGGSGRVVTSVQIRRVGDQVVRGRLQHGVTTNASLAIGEFAALWHRREGAMRLDFGAVFGPGAAR